LAMAPEYRNDPSGTFAPMPRAGSTLSGITLPDRYRVVRHLARGGMASVWEAEDELLGRHVAVKVLADHLAEDVSARERFQREARAAARVSDHPNVVTIYDVSEGEDGGRPFIVMELMTGGTVAERLRAARPSDAEALDGLRQAAAALDDAHERGLVHRDIKPGNLLLDARGRVGVADFGIARLARDQTVTSTGQVLGTAAYLSPEQARGDPATPASDRYALAVVAFQLLTGRRPFNAEHFAAQARQHIEAPPPPASSIRPELPPGVDAALGRGLAKEPARRWPTAGAMVQALERSLGEDPVSRTPPTRKLAAGRVAGAEVPPPSAFPVRTRRRPRRRLAVAVAVVAAIALVGAMLALTSGGGRERVARVDHATNKRAQVAERRRKQAARPALATQSTPAPNRTPAATAGASTDPVALNDQGYRLLQSGRPGQAIPVLRKAVDACRGDPSRLVCAYAMFNLARALRLTDRADEAVPLLERRLQNPDQRATVQRELGLARAQSGGSQSSDGQSAGGASPAQGQGSKPAKGPKPGHGNKGGGNGGANGD
jgi:eukaryotic-like serine/threonine-protein kinase